MKASKDLLDGGKTGKVKKKGNATEKLGHKGRITRKTADSVGNRKPEVLVKVSGFGKGAGHVKAHLNYISREGKLEVENDRGEVFKEKEELKEYFKSWTADFADAKERKNQRDTANLVLSMPEGTDPQLLKDSVRAFARKEFDKHEYHFALHTDSKNPHCHLDVKMRGEDGSRLNPRKEDLQKWRETFADMLNERGIDAAATPRIVRGVVRAPERQAVIHMEKGDANRPPRIPEVRKTQWEKAVKDHIEGKGERRTPEQAKREATRERVQHAWLAAAKALERGEAPITSNGKELKNVRPDYERIDGASAARTHRAAAALHQSNNRKARRQGQAGSLASVRNLPGEHLVRDGKNAQLSLHEDAPNRLDRERAADSALRRAGTGPDRTTGANDGGSGGLDGRAADNALAGRLRAFVKAMPTVETEQDRRAAYVAELYGPKREQERQKAATVPAQNSQADRPERPAKPDRAPEKAKGREGDRDR